MNDLMDPRVAQVYEELMGGELGLTEQVALRTANRIVELLDLQAERLDGGSV